ncbi:MAG: choice-of-anchor Q domain-containing protein [Verrucomicrobiota bacterium]|jgi:hypothetical protein
MSTHSFLIWRPLLVATICGTLIQPLRGQNTFVVTTGADGGTGSLRSAIANASDGDAITFAISGTITNLAGELLIGNSLDIIGPGPNSLAVSGNYLSRVFNISGGAVVSISGLTIFNGHAADGAESTNSATPGGPGNDGGGIYNSGTLTLSNCVVTQCSSGRGGLGYSSPILPFGGPGSSDGGPGGNGGGVYNAGTLTLDSCNFITNSSGSGGDGGSPRSGGLPGSAGGSGGNGGGIFDAGVLTATACTFGFNNAGAGGAGGRGGSGAASSQDGGGGGRGGDAGSGGGLYDQSSPTLTSCTFAGNTAGPGGSGGAGGSGYSSFQSIYPPGAGGSGGDGGTGGSGGGICCLGFFQTIACTITTNVGGEGGNGGQGGTALPNSRGAGGNGGNGGNGGSGGGGGGVNNQGGGSTTFQNVLAAQNLSGAGGLPGSGGAGGPGTPRGANGSAGANGPDGSGPDLLGDFTSNGHNLIGLADGNSGFTDGVLGDIVGSGTPLDARLGPLANNGGFALTCALLAGSPALDSGDDTLLDPPLSVTTDERGLPRRSGSHVDIGAFELQRAALPLCFTSITRTTNGTIQMTLTNLPGASLTLLGAASPALPLPAWTVLGSFPEIAPGQFQFIDLACTNLSQRFYRLRCP